MSATDEFPECDACSTPNECDRRSWCVEYDSPLVTADPVSATGKPSVAHLTELPACAEECGGRVRRDLKAFGIDAHVTHVPPLVPPRYEQFNMRCPHGVLWFTEPTSEQIAAWVREGVA